MTTFNNASASNNKILPGSRKIKISDIKIGTRRREDMGDIQGLADSLEKYGLIHPVVVDDGWNLVAGGRRMAAAALLGWEEVEVRLTGELSERELRVLELEENVRRKDLTEPEKSRNMVELVQVVRDQIKEENRTDSAQFKDEHKGGRGKKSPGSYRDISDRTGFPVSTIRDAEKHVQAIDKYPELKELPKEEAIKKARELDGQSNQQNSQQSPITREKIRETERYIEAVQKYPDLATFPHGQAIKHARERDREKQGLSIPDNLAGPLEKITAAMEQIKGEIKKLSENSGRSDTDSLNDLSKTSQLLRDVASLIDEFVKNKSTGEEGS